MITDVLQKLVLAALAIVADFLLFFCVTTGILAVIGCAHA